MASVLHEGRVVRSDGSGAGGAVVAVARGTAATPEIGIRCDPAGWFRIALPPGAYEIEARAPDGAVGRLAVEVAKKATAIEILVNSETFSED